MVQVLFLVATRELIQEKMCRESGMLYLRDFKWENKDYKVTFKVRKGTSACMRVCTHLCVCTGVYVCTWYPQRTLI